MIENLTNDEVRIIGCLMEKSVTTPEQYPLTLNALKNACNQKSSRDPVMSLTEGSVGHTANLMTEKGLIRKVEGQRANTQKYSQTLCNTLLGEYQFSAAEYAVLCLLLLRGYQTPGELRTRSGRLYEFADNLEVAEVLQGLIDREKGAVVARLPKKAGRQDHEYCHLFGQEQVESVAEEAVSASSPTVRSTSRVGELEARIDRLETALVDLASRLGERIELAPLSGEPTAADENESA